MKRLTNFRLSDEARALLGTMARTQGLTATAMLEVLIREAARARQLDTIEKRDASPAQDQHFSR